MEDRLHKFAVLVDSGTFTAAARVLHVSQPALSVAVNKLEAELHAKLLVRGVRLLTLTDAGRAAYAGAKDMAVCTQNLDLRLRELADAQLALKIGMIDSVAATLFARPTLFDALERHATVSVVVDNSRALLAAVERGELDLALVTQPAHRPPAALELQHVAAEPLVLVAKAHGHGGPPDTEAQLRRFISYDQPSTTFHIVQDALHGQGWQPEITFSSTSPEVMLRLVLMGRGVAALPYLLVRGQLETGELALVAPAQLPFIPRGIAMAKRRDKLLPAPLRGATLGLRRELEALSAEVSARAAQASSTHTTSLPRRSGQSK